MKGLAQPIMITPAEHAVLEAHYRYYYLTNDQLCRLLYKKGSLTTVQTRSKSLWERNLLLRKFLPRTTQHGSAPSVYGLDRKGFQYLEDHGFEPPTRFRPSEGPASYLHLYHTLACNDFFIAAELACRQNPTLTLQSFLHERVLKQQPFHVELTLTDPNGHRRSERYPVIPDGWLDMRVSGPWPKPRRFCISLEIDRATLDQKRWRARIRALVAWADRPYQERFQTDSLTIAVVAETGDRRRRDLLDWTARELTTLGKDNAELFLFSSGPVAEVTPSDLFLSPRWYQPFEDEPVPLLLVT